MKTTKRIKARRWRVVNVRHHLIKRGETTVTLSDKGLGRTIATLDVSDPAALIEQAALAIWGEALTDVADMVRSSTHDFEPEARAVLKSLGIIKAKGKHAKD